MLSTNQVLHQGRYRVINQFGNIASGSLYEAYDTFNETKVVLRETVGQLGKVATAAQIENLKTSFAAGAKRLTEVEHPALLKVRDYFSEIDRQYLVMEACDGSDLAELVGKSEKNLPLADVLRWADQLLDGLGYLNSKMPPIIHQRVCPQNIRLTSSFKVKLLVFGSDTTESGSESGDSADQPYRALEQLWLALDSASQKMIANSFGERSEEILRQPADARTDIYAVGATLYYILTRTVPPDPLNRYLEILDGNDDPLQKPSEIDPSIPPEVCEALMKAMELKREYRFESAASMRGELGRIKVPANKRFIESKQPDLPVDPGKDEEARLNDEQLRIEKDRMELEAGQKRLEEERARIEKRRLELEAEKKRQADLLEARRRDEERKKAEELKAEKAAADQRAAAESAAQARQEQAAKLREAARREQELAKDNLLDLPEHISEPALVPEVAADVLALEVERPSVRSTSDEIPELDLFGGPEPRRSFISHPAVLAGVAFAVLMVVGGIWMFSGAGAKAPTPAASIQNVATQADQPADTQSSFSTQPQPTPDPAPVAEQSVTEPSTSEALPADVRAKNEQLAKQKQLKAQAQQAKPTPEKKKTVTVDDLINDN